MSFGVAALAPFRGGRGALRMGLKPIAEADWLDRSPARTARAAGKAAIFDVEPDALIVLPGAEGAVAELCELLGVEGACLRTAALATFEDLLLLLPDGAEHKLVAGALAYPTDWHLSEKIGRPLAAIHAPIPTYAERLAGGVGHVFTTLRPGTLLMRSNWNVLETDTLRYLPRRPAAERFGGVTAAGAGTALFARVERQTLRRLPHSGAALFTIGVYVEPLDALPPALVADLARAVGGLPPDEARRRGSEAYTAALDAYAAARTTQAMAA